MEPKINSELFDFIRDNSNANPQKLLLANHNKNYPFDLNFAVLQIEGRQKYARKFKSYLDNEKFLFPSRLSAEQATHEGVARFHKTLIGKAKKILDMTGGLGIDSLTLASHNFEESNPIRQITVCDIDPLKIEILKHNTDAFGLKNITANVCDSVEFLKKTNESFDLIYIDPARRNENDKKIFKLKDCSPDILPILYLLKKKADTIIVKCSPLLDITQTLREIPDIRSVRAVSVKGECKEVLIEIAGNQSNSNNEFSLKEAISLDEEGNVLSYFKIEPINPNDKNEIKFTETIELKEGTYIYEPNASVMKFAPWQQLHSAFSNITKFAPNTHLFHSSDLHEDFPGRILKVEKLITNKDRRSLKGTPANIVCRNFPVSPEELRKRLGVREGKNQFIYAATIGTKPIIILSKLLNS